MKKFEQEIDELKTEVMKMGRLACSMVNSVIAALDKGDTKATKDIYANEHQMDQMELTIDHEAVRLMTVYSPVASDLRLLLSVTRITQELERVGDQAINMCEYLELLSSRRDIAILAIVKKMAHLVSEMLHEAIAAFDSHDTDKATVVIRSDNRVDALNDQVLQEVLSGEVTGSISISLAVILISRSLERIADQSTNICEAVIYMTKGTDIRHVKSE